MTSRLANELHRCSDPDKLTTRVAQPVTEPRLAVVRRCLAWLVSETVRCPVGVTRSQSSPVIHGELYPGVAGDPHFGSNAVNGTWLGLVAFRPHVDDRTRHRPEVEAKDATCDINDTRPPRRFTGNEPLGVTLPETTASERLARRKVELEFSDELLAVEPDHFEVANLDQSWPAAVAWIYHRGIPHTEVVIETTIGHLLRRPILQGMDDLFGPECHVRCFDPIWITHLECCPLLARNRDEPIRKIDARRTVFSPDVGPDEEHEKCEERAGKGKWVRGAHDTLL